MDGLDDDEWQWQPTSDDRISLRWRLDHLVFVLGAARNGPWLGLPEATDHTIVAVGSAADALAVLGAAYDTWRSLLTSVSDDAFELPIGEVGGRWAESSHRAY